MNSDDTVAIKHGVSGPNVDCCTPSVSYNRKVCKSKALPSACSANQEKEKGYGMISVNDGSQVIADSVSEALSRKDLTGGINLRRVNHSYEENCCFGQSPTSLKITEGSWTLKVNESEDPTQPLEQVDLSRCWRWGTNRGCSGQVKG